MKEPELTGWMVLQEKGAFVVIADKPRADATNITEAYSTFILGSKNEADQRISQMPKKDQKNAYATYVDVDNQGKVEIRMNPDVFWTAESIYQDAEMELPDWMPRSRWSLNR